MTNQLFESALGITAPWYVQAVDFDAAQRQLTIAVDFAAGSRFAYAGVTGENPVQDTQIRRLRHLNFFQHECVLELRVPRVRLPIGSVRLIEPDRVGQLNGFGRAKRTASPMPDFVSQLWFPTVCPARPHDVD